MKKNSTTMEYQKAIEYIFQMIKEGRLIVGSKIPSERDIAETLGIGRNSTREAISILRGMGLIESMHGSGNYISKDTGRSILSIVSVMLALGSISMMDIVEFRRVMARAIIDLIFLHGLSEEDREYIEKIVNEMETHSKDDLVELDQKFHVALIHATQNPLFITVMEAITEVYHESMQKVIRESDEETLSGLRMLHGKIYRSIVGKNKDACMKYIEEHYDLVENKLFGALP